MRFLDKETVKPSRPALRYHGGKWVLAPWIIGYFPSHRVYAELYGGAASVLLRKERSYAEVYNEVEGEITGYFEVLRDPDQAAKLRKLLRLTPFSRQEFKLSYTLSDDPVEQARRTVVRSFMGFSSDMSRERRTGFRANSNRSGTVAAHDWVNFPGVIDMFTERLQGVVIENKAALSIINQQDSPETLFYADPPYPKETRSHSSHYTHEMTSEDHRALAQALRDIEGMAIVSGYRCPLYDELYGDWRSIERRALADGARERIEVLWLSPHTAQALETEAQARKHSLADLPLFAGG